MIINNSVSADDYTTRAERIQLLSDNIDTFAVEIGVSGARLTAAQAADSEWEDVCAKCVVESGQKDEAYETFHEAVEEAANYYSTAKGHLLTIIYENGGRPDDFINAYGFNVRSPRRYKKLTGAIEAWKRNHDFLVGEGDPRVVPDAIMNQLIAHKNNIDALSNTVFIEKDESDTAFSEKLELFNRHTNLLKFIYTAAVLVWGNDDSRLNLLGFKPKSEIWTPGGGEPSGEIGVPTNLQVTLEGANVRISWDAVEGADGYFLVHTKFPPLFLKIYEGANTEFLHELPDNGVHYYMVRAKVGDGYGAYCEAVSIDVVVEPPAPPVNLNIVLVEGNNKTRVTWESAPGVVYDGCSLYVVDVLTGNPIPAIPASPMWDKLIVYSITLDVLALGKTRYVWVTGTKNGAESVPTGPVWISA